MSRLATLMGLALISGLALSACESGEGGSCSSAESSRADAIIALGGDEATGADTFTMTCGSGGCHGSDGDSGPAPDLSPEVGEFDDHELLCVMLAGYGDMPSQASLSDEQLADILAYVQATF